LSDLPRGKKQTLTIARAPDDPSDPRKNEPQVKTLGREMPLTKNLSRSLWDYADNHRKRGRHPFLFTSLRGGGAPLDLGAVNWIFISLVEGPLPHLKGRLHPHATRHTFNNRLAELANILEWDFEKFQRAQKYLNGWSEYSVMPEIYTRRELERQAMELSEKYQERLYSVF
jgi:integrase